MLRLMLVPECARRFFVVDVSHGTTSLLVYIQPTLKRGFERYVSDGTSP